MMLFVTMGADPLDDLLPQPLLTLMALEPLRRRSEDEGAAAAACRSRTRAVVAWLSLILSWGCVGQYLFGAVLRYFMRAFFGGNGKQSE